MFRVAKKALLNCFLVVSSPAGLRPSSGNKGRVNQGWTIYQALSQSNANTPSPSTSSRNRTKSNENNPTFICPVNECPCLFFCPPSTGYLFCFLSLLCVGLLLSRHARWLERSSQLIHLRPLDDSAFEETEPLIYGKHFTTIQGFL